MTIVCVMGMHRSGTSIASRALNLCGVQMGDESDRMPPNPYNPRGHWEHVGVVEIDDAVLEAFGGAWDDPPDLPPGWERDPRLEPLRAQARELIDRQFSASGLHGWKDPRASLTLPFWRTVTPVAATVVCVRAPHQVAASLSHRDEIGSERAARLWSRYVSAALASDPGCLVVFHDDLWSDPAGTVRRMAAHVGCPAPTPEVITEVEDFLDPALAHHADVARPEGPQMDLASALWESLESARRGAEELAALRARRSVRAAVGVADLVGRLRSTVERRLHRGG